MLLSVCENDRSKYNKGMCAIRLIERGKKDGLLFFHNDKVYAPQLSGTEGARERGKK